MRNEETRERLVNFPFSIDFNAFTRTDWERQRAVQYNKSAAWAAERKCCCAEFWVCNPII